MSTSEPQYPVGQPVIFYWPGAPTEENPTPLTLSGIVIGQAHGFRGTIYNDENQPYHFLTCPETRGWVYFVKLDQTGAVPTYKDGTPFQNEVVHEDQVTEGDEIAF